MLFLFHGYSDSGVVIMELGTSHYMGGGFAFEVLMALVFQVPWQATVSSY